jgi:class 3 adenylate cyclase
MLESRGLSSSQVERVNRFARGYPLVLEMAASAIRTQPDLEIIEAPPPKVLEQLTHVFLSGLPREVMEAVEASSTIRRVTEPQLRAVLNVSQVAEIFDELEKLPFVDMTTEGLTFHDVVRDTTSKGLAWRDPERYCTYRRRAWQFFSKESHECVTGNLWQCTADLLYLIENPVVKEAFFPEGVSDFIVEPATGSEGGDILEITATTEPAEASQWTARWWDNHPDTFYVAKSRAGKPEGFYFIFEPDKVDQALLADDPITAIWSKHLSENPIADGERALFLRRWLARTTGEAPSSVQGACWLDIKRTYMECRPSLRRLYTTVTDLATYAPIVVPLGFAPIQGASVSLSGVDYHSAVLDFGPSSVDGWIATLVGAELGIDAPPEAGEALTDEGRVLVTVLFTDIVESTEKASELGDRRWRDLLERHNTVVRGDLAKFQGREIDTAGDSFLCIFDSPASAIRCACSICESVNQLGMYIRAGLHLGECEAIKGGVRGIAVHIGARVAGIAGPGEILVSSTVKDAMAGSDIRFSDSGSHVLKGIKGKWRLFAVERT